MNGNQGSRIRVNARSASRGSGISQKGASHDCADHILGLICGRVRGGGGGGTGQHDAETITPATRS